MVFIASKIEIMTLATRNLTETDLNEVSGGKPNLGGYTYCFIPGTREGLYVGGCPSAPMTWGDFMGAFTSVVQSGGRR
jgi:hypothetical protein